MLALAVTCLLSESIPQCLCQRLSECLSIRHQSWCCNCAGTGRQPYEGWLIRCQHLCPCEFQEWFLHFKAMATQSLQSASCRKWAAGTDKLRPSTIEGIGMLSSTISAELDSSAAAETRHRWSCWLPDKHISSNGNGSENPCITP